MIDIGIIITGSIGIVTTIVSGWTSWFFARKKYYTEVDSNEIENLKESLKFYENIVKDNNQKLQFYIIYFILINLGSVIITFAYFNFKSISYQSFINKLSIFI